jgi:hypothetical protein
LTPKIRKKLRSKQVQGKCHFDWKNSIVITQTKWKLREPFPIQRMKSRKNENGKFSSRLQFPKNIDYQKTFLWPTYSPEKPVLGRTKQ